MTSPIPKLSAAILAGGLGTRLRSVVADRPKVLAPVACRPFLGYLLNQLAIAGIEEVVLLVGFGAEQVQVAFGPHYSGLKLHYSAEPAPLGTGGAIRNAMSLLREETVLLLNGDSYCDTDLAAFAAFHSARPDDISLVLASVPDAGRFGRVEVEEGGRILRFEEKRPTGEPGWINAGIYLFPRALLSELPAGEAISLERDVFPALVTEGRVRGFAGGRFIDIGVPESYAAAEAFFAEMRG